MKRRRLSLAWALAGAALMGAALTPATTAVAETRPDNPASTSDNDWTATFARDEGDASFRTSRTVPHWSSSFTDPTNQVTYPFTMAGSDPRLGGSTTVATAIVPLKFKFVAGDQDVSVLNVPARGYVAAAQTASMDGTDNVADTIASPIFTPTSFPISGDSQVQYGDAVMRAQFGKVGTSYHIKLGQPKVIATVSIHVPQGKGVAVYNPLGVLVGLVDATWFKSRLRTVINSLHLAPSTLPIFLSQNVFLYQDNFLHCCSLGGHGAGSPTSTDAVSIDANGKKALRTFVYAAYITPNSLPGFPAPFAGMSDILALSHEIAEWMNDPFGINTGQPWQMPTAPPGTCLAILETGDPVGGVWFPLPGNPNLAAGGVWHLQDQVFLNWFARDGEAPSLGPADGRYTYMGPYTTRIGGPFAAFGHTAQGC